jgi:hypothetical protein
MFDAVEQLIDYGTYVDRTVVSGTLLGSITAVNTTSKTITVTGNIVSRLASGYKIKLNSTTTHDGIYTVSGTPTYSNPSTTVTVAETIAGTTGAATGEFHILTLVVPSYIPETNHLAVFANGLKLVHNYQGRAYVSIAGLTGKCPALSYTPSTNYQANFTIDGGAPITVTATSVNSSTICGLVATINAAISPSATAYYDSLAQRIVVVSNNTTTASSSVVVADTGVNHMFSTIGITIFTSTGSGIVADYAERGTPYTFTTPSTLIDLTTHLTTGLIEANVIGDISKH